MFHQTSKESVIVCPYFYASNFCSTLHECLWTCVSMSFHVFPYSRFPIVVRSVVPLVPITGLLDCFLSAKPFAQKPSWQRQCDTVVTGWRHKAIIGHTVGKPNTKTHRSVIVITFLVSWLGDDCGLLYGKVPSQACWNFGVFSSHGEKHIIWLYVDFLLVKLFVEHENTSK